MNDLICYLFGAGEHYCIPPAIGPADYVIAVDGGVDYLERHGIVPDLFVGDLDSVSVFPGKYENIVLLPMEKNDTDMAAALNKGWELNYRVFNIYGGTGGRFDHTLANIQCIAGLAGRGGRGFLFERNTVSTAIRNDSIIFPPDSRGMVSVFSHSDISAGVCEKGLKYPLDNATLHNTYPLGVSNEFIGERSSITVRDGTLIIIYDKNIQEETK